MMLEGCVWAKTNVQYLGTREIKSNSLLHGHCDNSDDDADDDDDDDDGGGDGDDDDNTLITDNQAVEAF